MGDFSQRCDFAQKQEEHSDELIVAAKTLAVLVAVVLADDGVEIGWIDDPRYDLGENADGFVRHLTLQADGETSVSQPNSITSWRFYFGQV